MNRKQLLTLVVVAVVLGVGGWLAYQKQQTPYAQSTRRMGTKLIQDFPDKTMTMSLQGFVDHARHLDKLYIPTRYPNGLPDLTPFEVYTEEDARKAIGTARELIEQIASTIEG